MKKKLNTKISTEADLVGVDDASSMVLCTKLFIEAQVYKDKKKYLYKYNKSTILLLENGKSSLSKRAIYLNKGYFIFTDQVEKGNLTIKYCPTESMTAKFITLDKGKPTPNSQLASSQLATELGYSLTIFQVDMKGRTLEYK